MMRDPVFDLGVGYAGTDNLAASLESAGVKCFGVNRQLKKRTPEAAMRLSILLNSKAHGHADVRKFVEDSGAQVFFGAPYYRNADYIRGVFPDARFIYCGQEQQKQINDATVAALHANTFDGSIMFGVHEFLSKLEKAKVTRDRFIFSGIDVLRLNVLRDGPDAVKKMFDFMGLGASGFHWHGQDKADAQLLEVLEHRGTPVYPNPLAMHMAPGVVLSVTSYPENENGAATSYGLRFTMAEDENITADDLKAEPQPGELFVICHEVAAALALRDIVGTLCKQFQGDDGSGG